MAAPKLAGPSLGDRVKDTISGTTGIMVAYTDWLYGCRRVGVQAEAPDKDGKIVETAWFDEDQVTVVNAAAIKPKEKAREDWTGGPARGEESR